MKKRQTVSVVIPTFNGASFIEQAIESVVAQQRVPTEIIVVDDRSTDGTRGIVARQMERCCATPIRMLVTSKNSGGPAHPINEGIRHATGELIAVVDQDDVLAPRKLELQASVLESRPELSFAFSRHARLGENEPSDLYHMALDNLFASGRDRGPYREIPGSSMLRTLLYEGNIVVGYPGFMFRRSDWERLGGLDEKLYITSDLDFLCRLCQLGSVAMFDEIAYWRREHEANLTQRLFETHREIASIMARVLAAHPSLRSDRRCLPELRWQHTQTLVYLYRDHLDGDTTLRPLREAVVTAIHPESRQLISKTSLALSLLAPRSVRRSVYRLYTRYPRWMGWLERVLVP